MTLGAEECKADAKKVSLVHISRIFLTVMLIPNLVEMKRKVCIKLLKKSIITKVY